MESKEEDNFIDENDIIKMNLISNDEIQKKISEVIFFIFVLSFLSLFCLQDPLP